MLTNNRIVDAQQQRASIQTKSKEQQNLIVMKVASSLKWHKAFLPACGVICILVNTLLVNTIEMNYSLNAYYGNRECQSPLVSTSPSSSSSSLLAAAISSSTNHNKKYYAPLPQDWWCRDADRVEPYVPVQFTRGSRRGQTKTVRRIYDDYSMNLTETYTGECRTHIMNNHTWGKARAPFADKLQVKRILLELLKDTNSPVKIIPTIAHYDATNVSEFSIHTLLQQSQGQGFIIKPTHTSGGVAKVANGVYNCFKKCTKKGKVTIEHNPAMAEDYGRANVAYGMEKEDSKVADKFLQTQYQYIPPRIIVEPLLPLQDQGLYHFWVYNGHIAFAKRRCEHTTSEERRLQSRPGGSFVTADYRDLGDHFEMAYVGACPPIVAVPKTWDIMVDIAQTLSRKIHPMVPDVVRIDLYETSAGDVYFSEFTFTGDQCQRYGYPIESERLLYAMMHDMIDLDTVTPDFVDGLINGAACYDANGTALTARVLPSSSSQDDDDDVATAQLLASLL